MIIDFRNSKLVDPRNCPMKIDDENIEIVETYKPRYHYQWLSKMGRAL